MHYRPEIDGLRSLAVIPVVLFHAGFATFGGGFVGVDDAPTEARSAGIAA